MRCCDVTPYAPAGVDRLVKLQRSGNVQLATTVSTAASALSEGTLVRVELAQTCAIAILAVDWDRVAHVLIATGLLMTTLRTVYLQISRNVVSFATNGALVRESVLSCADVDEMLESDILIHGYLHSVASMMLRLPRNEMVRTFQPSQ